MYSFIYLAQKDKGIGGNMREIQVGLGEMKCVWKGDQGIRKYKAKKFLFF